jgi:hypothetical protein
VVAECNGYAILMTKYKVKAAKRIGASGYDIADQIKVVTCRVESDLL